MIKMISPAPLPACIPLEKFLSISLLRNKSIVRSPLSSKEENCKGRAGFALIRREVHKPFNFNELQRTRGRGWLSGLSASA